MRSEIVLALFLGGNSFRRARVVKHLAFWGLFASFQYFIYQIQSPLLIVLAAFMAKDLLAAIGGFYFFSLVVLPRFIVRRRWLLGALGLLAIYYGWALLSHLAYAALVQSGAEIGDWSNYMHRTLDRGLWVGVFSWYGVSMGLNDFIVLPMQPILLRFIVFLLRSSNRSLRLERENLNLEINFLKAQINPHFLFNTLNNLYLLVVKQDERAPEIVAHLTHLMHYTVHESDAALVPLEREIGFLEAYLELERLRYGRKVSIRYGQTGPVAGQRITPLLLFPFVENAFKHGVDSSLEESWVSIELTAAEGWLHLAVSNSFSPAAPRREVGGVGLVNVRKRLALHYAPTDYALTISQQPETYTYAVDLRLRLQPATAAEAVAPRLSPLPSP